MWYVGLTKFGLSSEAIVSVINSGCLVSQKLRDDPHSAQNPRVTYSEDLYLVDLPFVHVSSFVWKSIQLTTGAPEAFWHMPQWQYSVAKGEPETQYLTALQRQPPSKFLMFIFILVRPTSSIGRSFWIASEKLSTVLNCYTAYLAKEDWVVMRHQSRHLAISLRSKVIIPLFTKKDLKSNVTQA